MNSNTMKFMGYVARMWKIINAYNNLVCKNEAKTNQKT